jgi:predicted dinucleotide-binding enzyme
LKKVLTMTSGKGMHIKIGILGSGDVGQILGAGLVKFGHDVKLGSRTPESDKLKAWVSRAGGRASVGTFAEAASFGELVILATLWTGTENALRIAKHENFNGKIVIDTTNPLLFSSEGLPPRLAVGYTDSAGELVQRWLPKSRVVKAFNIVGNAHMINPHFPGGPPDMFICGNDVKAKQDVTDLLSSLGWPTIDIGGIEGSRHLEPLAMIWIAYGFRTGSWNHAFKLLRK